METILNFIVWDPVNAIFTIPGTNRPVVWYGVLFALGFFISQQILFKIWKAEGKPEKEIEIMTVYMIIATVVGARLGHVFFYEPARYLANPIDILKIWEGGLASHGATIAILLAIYIFAKKKTDKSYFWVLDRLVIVVALTGALIRFGNFTNSEILGKPTNSSYGVVFARSVEMQLESATQGVIVKAEASKGHHEVAKPYVPIEMDLVFSNANYSEEELRGFIEEDIAGLIRRYSRYQEPHVFMAGDEVMDYDLAQDRGTYKAKLRLNGIARHPGQLYESIACVFLFIFLLWYWSKYRKTMVDGTIFGMFLILLFAQRFFVEFSKENQTDFEANIPLNMGQWLSIPLVIAGIIVLITIHRNARKKAETQGTGS